MKKQDSRKDELKKRIYSMDLFDSINITADQVFTRVPGGWVNVYKYKKEKEGWNITSTFVPFNNEFSIGI